jgi:hypothetical protein
MEQLCFTLNDELASTPKYMLLYIPLKFLVVCSFFCYYATKVIVFLMSLVLLLSFIDEKMVSY